MTGYDSMIVNAIAGSESGKSTKREIAQDTGIEESALDEHLCSMKSRGLLTSRESELDGQIYYKLANG